MTLFEFHPDASKRIEQVVEHYPLSLEHCADLLEVVAPLSGALTADGAWKNSWIISVEIFARSK